ncbi:ankyrin repeat and fibronectin type-III domain-containing protein 1-like [Protopterus annectens]|uniref:ankyrin repeat and fibronectin type-III domain-containing protein 1-like n=1 Tax=Protopterus annectens TaxID=7888 RepID=UPI001CFB22F3|nr:ankyrin repeat and fibronectin type-III domain-containing protein 1-like [Protopterus annectens]
MCDSIRDYLPQHRSFSPGSPNAAKRIYRSLSGRLKGGCTSSESDIIRKLEKKKYRKSTALYIQNATLFEAVEHDNIEEVHRKLSLCQVEDDLNEVNEDELVPLDIAILTHNAPMVKALMRAGAKGNPKYVTPEDWASHLSTIIKKAEKKVEEVTQLISQAEERDLLQIRKQLKACKLRHCLYMRMKTGLENAGISLKTVYLSEIPDYPSDVTVSITSNNSLRVTFREPTDITVGVITKYKVEWSSSELFEPLTGFAEITDLRNLQYTIKGLDTGTPYYVRVSAYSLKGWGHAQMSHPPCHIPSSWKDCDHVKRRQKEQSTAINQLLDQVKDVHCQSFFAETLKCQSPTKKVSVAKSLKQLFQSSHKFVKTLKRGVYLAAILYRRDNILVTNEDQIPIVEIDSSCTAFVCQEFHWFSKVRRLIS